MPRKHNRQDLTTRHSTACQKRYDRLKSRLQRLEAKVKKLKP